MKTILFIILFIFISWFSAAQEFQLKITGQNEAEIKVIDSIGYQLRHKNTKSIVDENTSIFEKLINKGFIECKLLEELKLTDSTFTFKYNLGKKINSLHLFIRKEFQENINTTYTIKNDTLILNFPLS